MVVFQATLVEVQIVEILFEEFLLHLKKMGGGKRLVELMDCLSFSKCIKRTYNYYMVLSLNIKVLVTLLKFNIKDGLQLNKAKRKKFNNLSVKRKEN
jgi:hypothetical protein